MRNLSDMNDLYHTQDVILLCEIIESRFEIMYQKYFYYPRKCNSASSLSECIQRDLSKKKKHNSTPNIIRGKKFLKKH